MSMSNQNNNVNETELNEAERSSITTYIRNLSSKGMEVALAEIPHEWLWWELYRRFDENNNKIQGFEQIMKGQV